MLLAIGAFALAFGSSLALTPVAARIAHRFGILDHPEVHPQGRKKHSSATPYLGGVAIFVGLSLGASLLVIGDHPSLQIKRFAFGIAIAIAVGFVGLLDDIRPQGRLLRLTAQLGAAAAAYAIGFRVQAAPWETFNFILTVFWIVGITNSFNLLDNMDGLTAGLAGFGALGFAALGALGGLSVVALTAAALAGAAFGFLVHNRHPASVFMGDAGALFLGFLLALIGIDIEFDNLEKITFLIPVVVLGLPIFDTTVVVYSRLRNRRPVLLGGRDHVSHRLVAVGLPVRAAVGLLYWSSLCLGWLGLVISRSNVQVGWMLLSFVLALGFFFAALLLNVPVYDVPSTETAADLQEPKDREMLVHSLEK